MDMFRIKIILLQLLWYACGIAVALIVVYECGWLQMGALAEQTQKGFYAAVVMELTTIVMVPMALRLFKFRFVSNMLRDYKEKALLKWGAVRILMLCVPMVLNTLCYYLFMNAAFAYMAIILFLCLFFVYPTTDKCYAEIPTDEQPLQIQK